MDRFFLLKPFNHYGDIFLLLGVARLVEDILRQLGQMGGIRMFDRATHYELQLNRPLDLEGVKALTYIHPFYPVRGAKTPWDKMPEESSEIAFNTVTHSERRKVYREALYHSKGKLGNEESAPTPPDPRTQNGVFLTSQRCDRNHNGLWLASWQRQEHYGCLVAAILQALDRPRLLFPTEEIAQTFQQWTGETLPRPVSSVKIYLPNAVQGVNRTKADNNKVDSQKTDWLTLWAIASGFFECALSERVKVAEGTYDWRVVAANPKDISLSAYRQVLDRLRRYNPPGGGHGAARFDCETILKLCLELLDYHTSRLNQGGGEEFRFLFVPPPEAIGELVGTHFNSKGQVYGVKELFAVGLPGWIRPQAPEECSEYRTVIEEHLQVLRGLTAEDGHSELLALYRDFVTGHSVHSFFPFAVHYADFVVARLANPRTPPPRLFSSDGLNLMVKQDTAICEIVRDPSFIRIAKAINQATVHAGKIRTKDGEIDLDWQRQYGLAQELSARANSKIEFASAISDFLGKYAHENMRLQEHYLKTGRSLKRVQPTTADLDRLMELLDTHNATLVANLLIAYGYARWKSKDESTQGTEDNPDTTDESLDN
ncbi:MULTISPECIES: hypothetical protein [Spirulina sp. CCY15215]|uniref:hypothetical protein n=1 Tax=Spirulina sp. CCY15215 TaxID=2767591 RepID=UPI0019521C7E|nr:hypothetical protein [Spirulina major]